MWTVKTALRLRLQAELPIAVEAETRLRTPSSLVLVLTNGPSGFKHWEFHSNKTNLKKNHTLIIKDAAVAKRWTR